MSYKKYDYESLKSLSEIVFQKYGYSAENAKIITDVLLGRDLSRGAFCKCLQTKAI